MALCQHGTSRDKRCYACEDIAEAENRVKEKAGLAVDGRTMKEKPTMPMPPKVYEEDDSYIDIDQYKLDFECVRQPRLYRQQADLLADAELAYDEAKAAVDVAEAEIKYAMARAEQRIRKDPDLRGGDTGKNPTEALIASYVITEHGVEATKEKMYETIRNRDKAKNVMNHLKAVVKALEQRKDSIENLVKLFLNNYYAEPRTPKGLDKDNIRAEKRNRGVTKKEVIGDD